MNKILVLACLVAILFAGKVHAQTGAPGFSIYSFNSALGVQISLWAAGGAVSTIKVDSGHFLTGSPQGNVQLKPNVNTVAIQYVSLSGNDANDGLSWGTAKQTIYAALEGLPFGSASPPQSGQGTVYVSSGYLSPFQSGSVGCGVGNGGIWLMGQSDPNYASPPCGWLRIPAFAGAINIIGVPRTQGGPNPHTPSVIMSKGTGTVAGDPGFWFSSTNIAINVTNIGAGGGNRGILIGQCSNGGRTDTCQATNITFTSDTSSVNNAVSTAGPCTDITGGSFWIWFRDFGCTGNAVGATSPTNDNAAAILVDGRTSSGIGLITIKDSNLAGGGIKVYSGSGSPSNVFVDNVTEEGDFVHTMPPVVWMTDYKSPSTISNVICADCGGVINAVQIDPPAFPPTGQAFVTVINSSLLGPAIVLGGLPNANTVIDPLRQGQLGFIGNNIVGQTDVARRNDALVAARYLNRASANTATWSSSDPGNTTITTGLTDPFGGTGAARFTHNIAGTAGTIISNPGFSYTSAVGDWVITGIWEQFMNGDNNLQLPGTGLTSSTFFQDNGMGFEDRWVFRWRAFKVSNAVTVSLFLNIQYSNTLTPLLYGPILYVIPSGTLSDNEVIDFATSMASTDSACPVGTICNVAGHPVQLTALSLNRSNQMTSVSGNSGQVAQSSGTLSQTKLKTADANGNIIDAGGSGALGITFPSKTYASSAICNNTAADSAWNLPTSAAPTVSCRTGTNIQEGTLNFADADSAQFSLPLASDWTGAIDARLIFFSRDTRGTVIFQIATSCTATSGSTVDDIAFNTADVFTTITLNAAANAQWETNKTSINITGCSPLNTLQVKISRAKDTASSRVSVKGLELTVRRAL
jgi:hypothetical protein